MSSSFEILGIEATFNLPLVFAVLPASRSVEVGCVPATAFLTGINSSTDNAPACGIAAGTSIPADFTFQTTDPLTNAVVGSPDTPVDVAAGEACGSPPATLVSSVLPTSRSVEVGVPATAFATIINTDSETASACTIAPVNGPSGTFLYQTTDPATKALTGTPNTPVDIPGNNGSQSFLFAITPDAPFDSAEVELDFDFDCADTGPAAVVPGLNTLLMSASSTPVPDIIALAATLTMNGMIELPGLAGSNAFAVATSNVGAAGAITASADTGTAVLPVSLFICQTEATGACLAPQTSA